MYSDSFLTTHLQKSSSVETKSKVLAEWNLNTFENIEAIGNYKNRPTSATDYNTTESNSADLASITYASENANTVTPTWYGYTDYDTVIDGGYTDTSQIPVTFRTLDERQKSLMSLEDCFKKFRPRSGINKLRNLNNASILPISGSDAFLRPRYYAASKDDNFKYWSSYRKYNNEEFGISKQANRLIDDSAPFIKYKNQIATNKIVVKIQTNVSLLDKRNSSRNGKDPYWIEDTPNYKSTPEYWKIQKLNSSNVWEDIYTSTADGFTSSAGWDGYFQLSYGVTNIPSDYTNNFIVAGELSSTSALPNIQGNSFKGQAYLVKESTTAKGTFYIYNGGTSGTILDNYAAVVPTYGWYRSEESISNTELFVTQLDRRVAPKYIDGESTIYREFQDLQGIRVVVNKMINKGTTFDLIELSPRLSVDLTNVTKSFSIKKFASDLGVSSMPVGQLLPGTGNLSLFDDLQVFNQNNTNSLLNIYANDSLQISFTNKNLQIKFYEIVRKVRQGTSSSVYKDYYVPLKTLYADGFPNYQDAERTLDLNLRDFCFHLESQIAPELLLTKASLSFIVATLLDYVGFSNYKFIRLSKEKDVVIPYFMVSTNKTIMQVLQDLAIATQTTMFFDEANNFIVMGKRYLVPDSTTDRDASISLYGSDTDTGIKANIKNIASQSSEIYNDGKIVYYNKYILRGANKIKEVVLQDKYKEIGYKPSILWALNSIDRKTQSINEESETSSGYALSAVPLATDLSADYPKVVNGEIVKNEIDFKDGATWLQRFAGYLYANGEIIKYDAIEYTIPSIVKVWVESNDEYQKYYSSLKPGQKMYRTGKVRIYAEPNYDSSGNIVEGDVAKHGREQFGTKIALHTAGVPTGEWIQPKTPLVTNYQYLFKDSVSSTITEQIKSSKEDISNRKMIEPKTTIKNFLSQPIYNKTANSNYIDFTGSVQASALIMEGPTYQSPVNASASINYVKKEYSSKYDIFGTRLRILGDQTPTTLIEPRLTYPYTDAFNNDGTSLGILNAASGGMAIMTNSYGEGYYYEIVSINYKDVGALVKSDGAKLDTVFFYKMETDKKGYTTQILDGTLNGLNTILQATGGETLAFPGNETGIETVSAGDVLEIRNSSGQAGIWTVINNGSGADPWKLERTVPVLKPTKLYSSFQEILPNTGQFAAKVLGVTEKSNSVYDINIKVNKVSTEKWIFNVYLNGNLLKSIVEKSPITNGVSTNISLFTRGSSELMFDNVFAIDTITKNLTSDVANSAEIFDDSYTSNISYSVHALSPLIIGGFLSKISPSKVPETQIDYEEFGTIMRECSYFNVKFEKYYPAITSQIAPLPQSITGYFVAGYNATPYRAEFLIFNTTDFALNIGSNKSGSGQLSITGLGFTENTPKDLTVDDFYGNKSSFGTNQDYTKNYKDKYTDIKNNRLAYGSKAFTIDSPYIQDEDTAKELMDYTIKKISKPRKAVGVEVFGMPIIQLGDLVNFSYDTQQILPNSITGSNFVVYAIEHQTSQQGPSTMLYLSEVV